jgi:hypothetical protein
MQVNGCDFSCVGHVNVTKVHTGVAEPVQSIVELITNVWVKMIHEMPPWHTKP